MIFGHLVDNIRRAKSLFVLLEISCSVWFMIMGASFFADSKHFATEVNPVKWSSHLFPMCLFLICGLQILQIIQLFNWFSKRRICLVVGIWYFVQQLGYFTRAIVEKSWQNFPTKPSELTAS
jgi:hypothetical protein